MLKNMDNDIKPIIRLQDLSKIYSSNGAVAVGLHKVNAEFYQGEFIAVTGSSGSGKSTLLNVISCIDSYEEGEMYLFGEETAYFSEADRAEYRKKHVAFIFQDYNIIDSYTVYQNVELALLNRYPVKAERRRIILELLDKVGLRAHANHRATRLSGGQKQRVSIARALAKDAPILFADEPTGNLDSKTSAEILSLLRNLSKDKLVIVVTHSFDQISAYATRKIRLADGAIVEDSVLDISVRIPYPIISDVSKKKSAEIMAISTVAKNNMFSTPKRTFFSLTGLIMLSLMFIWLIIGLMAYNKDDGYHQYYCKTDIQIVTNPARDLTVVDIEAVKALDGVITVNYFHSLLNSTVSYILADEHLSGRVRPKSVFDGLLYSGRLPEQNSEIVLNLPAKRRFTSMNLLNTTISIQMGSTMNTFTIVGLTANGDSSIYVFDDMVAGNPADYTGNSTRYAGLVAVVNDLSKIKAVRQQLEAAGYLTYYMYAGASNLGIDKISIYIFSFLVVVIMFFVFRAVQGSVKTVSESKKRDYNIMRTVGLSDFFIKLVYYFEMIFLALFAWMCTIFLSFIGVLVYSLVISPTLSYGFSMILSGILRFAWISALALLVIMFLTVSNA
ncbi:MAG: ABC transporter ATP-binding protein/permease, partial [Clostridia bacterium]|nr:ABC transporter ATP-binding protein/permease [Clostridia bacterium]